MEIFKYGETEIESAVVDIVSCKSHHFQVLLQSLHNLGTELVDPVFHLTHHTSYSRVKSQESIHVQITISVYDK